jgi:hypothetical protein
MLFIETSQRQRAGDQIIDEATVGNSGKGHLAIPKKFSGYIFESAVILNRADQAYLGSAGP